LNFLGIWASIRFSEILDPRCIDNRSEQATQPSFTMFCFTISCYSVMNSDPAFTTADAATRIDNLRMESNRETELMRTITASLLFENMFFYQLATDGTRASPRSCRFPVTRRGDFIVK
jgi:hypothetical protein